MAESVTEPALPPLLQPKAHNEPSVLHVETCSVKHAASDNSRPRLVPDVCPPRPRRRRRRHLRAKGTAICDDHWACYHSELWLTTLGGRRDRHRAMRRRRAECGLGRTGTWRLRVLAVDLNLVSGSDRPARQPPYFVLIERARRDEGTSLHYTPPSEWSDLSTQGASRSPVLLTTSTSRSDEDRRGRPTPLRETASAIESARAAGVHAVEMEAAALNAFGRDRRGPCPRHEHHGDFRRRLREGRTRRHLPTAPPRRGDRVALRLAATARRGAGHASLVG